MLAPDYVRAKEVQRRMRNESAEIFERFDVILVPTAPTTAPAGLESTGDSRMNAPWTALGVPAISMPMPVAVELPLGLQLTADHVIVILSGRTKIVASYEYLNDTRVADRGIPSFHGRPVDVDSKNAAPWRITLSKT